MLFLVGLGLGSERDITVEALEVVKRATRVYLEVYTSVLIGKATRDEVDDSAGDDDGPQGMELEHGKARLERFYGREIILADREMVESASDEILAGAETLDVAFLVVGDPFGATTHGDLTLRARDLGIPTRTFHNASIMNAVGAAGLSLYNYGQTISIPWWTDTWRPTSFVARIQGNRRLGAHTLALLDIKVKEQSEANMARGRKIYEPPRYMDVPTAARQLLQSLDGLEDKGVDALASGLPYSEDTLALSCSRLGSSSQTIILAPLGTMQRLPLTRFGEPLHSLVILGGQVHPIERDIASTWMLNDNGESLGTEEVNALWEAHDQEWTRMQRGSMKKVTEGPSSEPIAIRTKTGAATKETTARRAQTSSSSVTSTMISDGLSLSPKSSRYHKQSSSTSPRAQALSFGPSSQTGQQRTTGPSGGGGHSLSSASPSSHRLPAFYRGSPNGRSGFVSSSPGTRTVIESMTEAKPAASLATGFVTNEVKGPKREHGDLPTIHDTGEDRSAGMGLGMGRGTGTGLGSEAKGKDKATKKDPPTREDGTTKSKAELKAERRAKQEAQRAAKTGSAGPTEGGKSKSTGAAKEEPARTKANQKQNENRARRISTSAGTGEARTRSAAGSVPANVAASARKAGAGANEGQTRPGSNEQGSIREPKTVSLFGHLEHIPSRKAASERSQIHPSIRALAVQMSEFRVVGANARAIALLLAFKKVIRDYSTPAGTSLSRHLMIHLNPQISRLVAARPLGVSMGNAIRFIKYEISVIHIDLPEEDAKVLLCEKIDHFIRDRIIMADRLIVEHAVEKIVQDDVILIFARSSVVEATLLEAKARNTEFAVIVVDSGPLHEGLDSLRVLMQARIPTTLVSISAIGSIIQRVTKLFLGTAAVFSNGACYARAGTASIALAAKEKGAPVLVLCESYKFSDRVQLDSIVSNELGSPESLLDDEEDGRGPDSLKEWRALPSITLLNLLYDVTLPEYIMTLVTEMGLVPVTSVPIVLREYRPIMAS